MKNDLGQLTPIQWTLNFELFYTIPPINEKKELYVREYRRDNQNGQSRDTGNIGYKRGRKSQQ